MLRLVIVDDERAIREAISREIEWEKMGIEVIALCKNGVEAYDTILDEYPDIVLTDVKMPGLSGLELIAKVKEAHLDTEFVILSGFAEFEFAKEAMKWGVRHYLLKPTNPQQITQILTQVREACYQKRKRGLFNTDENSFQTGMRQRLIRGLLTEALSGDSQLSELIERNRPYLDFSNTNYELCYLYYVEPQNAAAYARQVEALHAQFASNTPLTVMYVNLALIFFFESYSLSYEELETAMSALKAEGQTVEVEFKHVAQSSLEQLMHTLLPTLIRFDTVDLMSGERRVQIHNYSRMLRKGNRLIAELAAGDEQSREQVLNQLEVLLNAAAAPEFLSLMATGFLVKYATLTGEMSAVDSLTRMEEMSGTDMDKLRTMTLERLKQMSTETAGQDLVSQIKRHVRQNLSNPDLSLKWLAENCLYMNVDYLSHQFSQKAGEKFSAYLTRKRIERAKELLAQSDAGHVYDVAGQVGCGNNPQYFSQIFKHAVGMTPTEFQRISHQENNS